MTSLSEPAKPGLAKQLSHPNYRPDIDGLRAIAVLAVIIFHAFPSLLKGGFVGVDVFFVISGFLISSIIIGSMQNNNFLLVTFYIRRINRIFPALIATLAATWVAGWFILYSSDFAQLGKHIAGGAAFVSNFVLRGEAGYFDSSAETKPLLHLWSLGIEEQFYLVWPLLVWLAFRARTNPIYLVALVGTASFALNAYTIHSDPISTFYLPFTRFWELLIGSLLACLMLQNGQAFQQLTNRSHIQNLLSVAGTLLLVLAFVLTKKDKAFPGWWALLPTLGTALIIAAGPRAWLNRTVLSNRILVWFGLISFPLYLWHWPLLSFSYILEDGVAPRVIRAGLLALSVVLAWLTYRLIERPLRANQRGKLKPAIIAALMVIIGAVGYITHTTGGFKFRLKEDFSAYFENSLPEQKYFKKIDLDYNYRGECDFYDIEAYRRGEATNKPDKSIDISCHKKNDSGKKTLFIWGDSHAMQLYGGLAREMPKDWQLLQVASSGCPASPDAPHPSEINHCEQSNWFAIKSIREVVPDVVIVGQNKDHDPATLRRILALLSEIGVKRVIFTGPTPHWKTALPKTITQTLWSNTPRYTSIGLDDSVLIKNSKLKQELENSSAVFADIISVFCKPKGCMIYVGDDVKTGITSWDYGHLTPAASAYLARTLLVKLVLGEQPD